MNNFNIYDIMGNRMYATEEYMECLKNRTIVLDEKQARIVEGFSHGNVIDLGANIGHMTLLMAKNANKVYAFEPEPLNFKLLKMNVELNELANVELFECAATDSNKFIDLHLCKFNNGMHRIYPSKYCKGDKITIKAIKVDDVVDDKINFVKIDTEGAELGVLKGMKRILSEDHPTIMLEFHPPSIKECGDEPKYVYDIIMNEGYRCMLLGDGDPDRVDIPYEALEHITTHNVARNVVFMHF